MVGKCGFESPQLPCFTPAFVAELEVGDEGLAWQLRPLC